MIGGRTGAASEARPTTPLAATRNDRQQSRSACSLSILIGSLLTFVASGAVASQQQSQTFTVADEIGLAQFGAPFQGQTRPITPSPDGRFAAVHVERGVLATSRLEDELRVYDIHRLQGALQQSRQVAPNPTWTIRESTYRDGPLISHIRWLPDSKGVAYLLTNVQGRHQIILSDLQQQAPAALTPENQDVTAFDIRDSLHFVYTVPSAESERRRLEEGRLPAIVGTGRSLVDLVLPAAAAAAGFDDRCDLWAATGGPPHPVIAPGELQPTAIYLDGQRALALSPDATTVATSIAIANVPTDWEASYPPLNPNTAYRLRAGHQDLGAVRTFGLYAARYVAVDLSDGHLRPLVNAPTGYGAGWYAGALVAPTWSHDNHRLLLPNTFLSPAEGVPARRPCIAVADLTARTVTCIQEIPNEPSYDIEGLRFVGGDTNRVELRYASTRDEILMHRTRVLHKSSSGEWLRTSDKEASEPAPDAVRLSIREGLNASPVLVAVDTQTQVSRDIWDPNPQLRNIALGEASAFQWRDPAGRQWTGGLYKPPDQIQGNRYPLVIQTHGFSSTDFRPSGVMPTAFAARALAAAGMVVLQVPDCEILETSSEGRCEVAGYAAAIEALQASGLVDSRAVGIIGFSRSVYYVMEALTDTRLAFSAASITDGVNVGYWQYLEGLDLLQNHMVHEFDAMIGERPFGAGLRKWVQDSPEFNLQAVSTPLLVVAEGLPSLLFMWEPYAGLRHLQKPVEMIILNDTQHILTNPSSRIASQGGSVDWFGFWLNGHEDRDPEKEEQYRRWEKLCDLQIANNSDRPAFCVRSKPSVAN